MSGWAGRFRVGCVRSSAPVTSTIRGLSTEVPVGRINGLDHDSVISCDNITTVPWSTIGGQWVITLSVVPVWANWAICVATTRQPRSRKSCT